MFIMGQSQTRRLELHAILLELMPDGGKVYFQPPENTKITYPCIVYQRNYAATQWADNNAYSHTKRYQVTTIDRNPDSEIPDKVAALPFSTFQRFFVVENLNHDVYNVYF